MKKEIKNNDLEFNLRESFEFFPITGEQEQRQMTRQFIAFENNWW